MPPAAFRRHLARRPDRLVAIVQRDARWLLLAPLAGYGFAWIGHFFFEKNRPATFTHPLYSFAGDWVMFWDVLRGRVRL